MKSNPNLRFGAWGVGILVLLLGSLGSLLYRTLHQWSEAENHVAHIQESIAESEKIRALVSAAESSVRAFTITGQDEALRPYRDAFQELDRGLASLTLAQHETDHPDHLKRLEALKGLVARRRAAFFETISARRERGFTAAQNLLLTGRGTRLTAEIGAVIAGLQAAERDELQRWGLVTEMGAMRSERLWTAAFLVVFLFVVGAFISVLWGLGKRRAAEDALAHAHAQLQGVLDGASQISIIATDTQGLITLFNKGSERLLGYAAGEVVGKKTPAAIHLESEVATRARELGAELGRPIRGFDVFVASARQGHFDVREWTYVRKDGSQFPVELITTALKDQAGAITGFLGVGVNIAKRKEAEARLKKLSIAVEQSPASIVITDQTGAIEYVNPKFTQLTGYSLEEARGKNPRILQAGKTPREVYQRLWETILSGREWRGELLNKKKDGGLFWEQAIIAPLKNAQGAVVNFVAVKEDITARKQAQDALRESEEQFRLLLDSTAEAIYGIDLKGCCTFCNPACVRLAGYERPDQLLGKNMHDLIHHTRPDGSPFPVEECRIFRAFQKGVGSHVDDEVLWRADGTSFPAEYWSYPQRKDGAVIGSVVTFLDITKRKRAEAAMAQARDAAVEYARLKADFLANMSHEIRTPMNAIIGMTGLLLGTELSAQQRDYAKTVNTAGETLLDIVNEILDFSKIEAGKLSIEAVDFDLRETADIALELVAPRAHEKRLELALSVEPGTPAVLRGDAGRVRQILLNLLGNAVKFTERGEVVLRISQAGQSGARTSIRFEVKDTGIGISPEGQRRLFQSFSQADSSTTRKYGGTGLGLVISKKLVELMGGSIAVESRPGQGSTFFFTLPLEAPASSAPLPPPGELAGLRALVVDDNAANREILVRQLASWKVESEAVPSGEEALRALRPGASEGRPCQLVLLDMQMPEMDGLALARAIRSDPALARLPLVMMSSIGQSFKPEELQAAGIAECLPKPVRQSLLFNCLRRVMGGVPSAADERRPVVVRSQEAAMRKFFRILVAEDNPVNQKVALLQLKKLGYEADTAANGLEALEALQRFPYDLVLMDCQMPEMDGFTAAGELRKREEGRRHTPVVAMTANALEGDREKCLAAGMDDYIAKPVSIEALRAAIARWDVDFDPEPLQKLRELAGPEDAALVADVIHEFLDSSARLLAKLKAGAAAGDIKAVQDNAHALKGASGNVGAAALRKISARLEALARSGTLEGSGELLAALESAVPPTRQRLDQELGPRAS
ncbi:MAG: PAS domain S-box protein [Elusimicrobia bacterium]|nr:PAS domain S-box protein [Elusimicrobiota bacterium]